MLDAVVSDLTTITGQKAVITKAKKSVANFKLREEMPIGAKVTLPEGGYIRVEAPEDACTAHIFISTLSPSARP